MSSSVQAVMDSNLTVTETFSAGSGSLVVNSLNEDSTVLTGSTSPAVTKQAKFSQALTSGAATIDLTALPGITADETVTGSTLKVQIAKFRNPSTNANPITVTFGASNGYLLAGAAWKEILQPGQSVLRNLNGASPTIDSTHKTIDLAGTASQALDVQLVMG